MSGKAAQTALEPIGARELSGMLDRYAKLLQRVSLTGEVLDGLGVDASPFEIVQEEVQRAQAYATRLWERKGVIAEGLWQHGAVQIEVLPGLIEVRVQTSLDSKFYTIATAYPSQGCNATVSPDEIKAALWRGLTS